MSRDGFAAIEREEREAQDARDLRHAEQPAKNYGCHVTQLEFDTLLNRAARFEVALRNISNLHWEEKDVLIDISRRALVMK